MKKKIYISIPIKNQDYNYQRGYANNVAKKLNSQGFSTVTPFDLCPATTSYNEAMGKCIEELLGCQAIYLCTGWQKSDGCKAELQVALVYGKEILVE